MKLLEKHISQLKNTKKTWKYGKISTFAKSKIFINYKAFCLNSSSQDFGKRSFPFLHSLRDQRIHVSIVLTLYEYGFHFCTPNELHALRTQTTGQMIKSRFYDFLERNV